MLRQAQHTACVDFQPMMIGGLTNIQKENFSF